MKWSELFTSSVGKKIVMSVTGLFLISFLVIHAGVNACIFADLSFIDPADDGLMFNRAAAFMGGTVLIRIMEIVLFIGFFIHIIQGFVLEVQNRSKRRKGYAVAMGNRGSKWYSRSMGLLGTILLLFLIIHWWHFWVPSRFTHAGLDFPADLGGGRSGHDMFALMQAIFSEWWVVILYVVACISLAYHLMHGFQSAFRTLGMSNTRYIKLVSSIGFAFSVIISIVFALMPIAMKLQWVHKDLGF
jgi:succinate dehydrogenase / fumarate reductase, cytochrome b subunit